MLLKLKRFIFKLLTVALILCSTTTICFGFGWSDLNPVKHIKKGVDTLVDTGKKVVNTVVDTAEDAANFAKKIAEETIKKAEQATKLAEKAAKKVAEETAKKAGEAKKNS